VSASRVFPPQPESVAKVRAFARAATRGLEPSLQDDVVLMVSELATNALLYATGEIDVTVDCGDDGVYVAVADGGSGRPRLRPTDLLRPFGRGLHIVDELSDDWGSSRSEEGGTVVWFRLGLEPRREARRG
jgi:anti-sigma regulatory factor (Ser/Thr protein kinase)